MRTNTLLGESSTIPSLGRLREDYSSYINHSKTPAFNKRKTLNSKANRGFNSNIPISYQNSRSGLGTAGSMTLNPRTNSQSPFQNSQVVPNLDLNKTLPQNINPNSNVNNGQTSMFNLRNNPNITPTSYIQNHQYQTHTVLQLIHSVRVVVL